MVRMTLDGLLARLLESVPEQADLESLTRPLLELLEAVTGFESTYLTFIDIERGEQTIGYARNVADMKIPEALTVPWDDTLCKRALEEGRLFTDDVADCWGDSEAARQLGIQSYASTPVQVDGQVCGTLCAASARTLRLGEDGMVALRLFARLIGQQIERERLIDRLKRANLELAAHAQTDMLTGLPNRRLLMPELQRALARGARDQSIVMVAVIDLDRFKQINDTLGHEAGDNFLIAMARRLQSALRATDLLARTGGDEFVVLGPGPSSGGAPEPAVRAWHERLARATVGHIQIGDQTIDYAGASVGVTAVGPGQADADEALRRADAAMYAEKRQRRDAIAAAYSPASVATAATMASEMK